MTHIPEFCYSISPDGKVIRINRGEVGYHISEHPAEGDEAKQLANELNEAAGITHNVRSAMENGSMFGWSAPCANPEDEINKKANIESRNIALISSPLEVMNKS